ncbi:hypothetical protein [Sphingobium sp. MK2]|uniref:hypothetical protein n=1 Tax=Sphingobium sp. MK2 TaxID=3116540 RepID=UPI0032E364E2
MGIWDSLKELGSELGQAAMKTMASYGQVEKVIEELKESPKSGWSGIIEAAYREAEEGPGDLRAFSDMFSKRLSDLEDEDSRFRGVHTLCMAVIAKIGIQKLADR